jgi:hypothetical protein
MLPTYDLLVASGTSVLGSQAMTVAFELISSTQIGLKVDPNIQIHCLKMLKGV